MMFWCLWCFLFRWSQTVRFSKIWVWGATIDINFWKFWKSFTLWNKNWKSSFSRPKIMEACCFIINSSNVTPHPQYWWSPDTNHQAHQAPKILQFHWLNATNQSGVLWTFLDVEQISKTPLYHRRARIFSQKFVQRICAAVSICHPKIELIEVFNS